MKNTRAENTISNFLLSLFSFIFIFILLEVVLRLSGYNPFGELINSEERAIFIRPAENPLRIFEATPNARGFGWGTDISINRHGFRGKDYSVNKPKGVYRIIVIGDSIAFGNNLPSDKNYSAQLEKKFASNGIKVEVLNFGLGGYDTLQEVATLEDIGLKFSPDLVILGYCINDIGIASGNLNYINRLKKYGTPIYKLRLAQFIRIQLDRIDLINYTKKANSNENFAETYKNMLADISKDTLLAQKTRLLSTALAHTEKNYPFSHDYIDATHQRRLRYALEKLKSLQESHEFEVAVLLTPYLIEDADSRPVYQAIYTIIEHEMTRLNFPVINLYPPFHRAGLEKMILKKNDGIHPNEYGHEIMANEIYKTVSTAK